MTVDDVRALADRLERAATPPVAPLRLVGVAAEAVVVLRLLADLVEASLRSGVVQR